MLVGRVVENNPSSKSSEMSKCSVRCTPDREESREELKCGEIDPVEYGTLQV